MTAVSWLRSQLPALGARLLHTRALVRAPIWIYRSGAGALLGPRLLMLEHLGRNSGLLRNVVLEVVDHPSPDRYLVASGFGEEAQWLRNIKANSQVRVYLGSRRPAPATARVLTRQEAGRALSDYARHHPQAWNSFKPVLERTFGNPIDETDTSLPIVELRLA